MVTKKASFENSAHAPTNESRQNVISLLKNERGKSKAEDEEGGEGAAAERGKSKSRDNSTALMGLRGLKKSKKSKKAADKKEKEVGGHRQMKEEEAKRLNAESAEALKEHSEELSTIVVTNKKQRRKLKQEADAKKRRMIFNVFCCVCVLLRCWYRYLLKVKAWPNGNGGQPVWKRVAFNVLPREAWCLLNGVC